MENETRKYELGYLLSPMIPVDRLESTVSEEIVKVIKSAGGEVLASPSPLLRDLAYPIKKDIGNSKSTFKTAYFGSVSFNLDPISVVKFGDILTKNDLVVRHLLIIAPKVSLKKVKIKEDKVITPVDDNQPAVAPTKAKQEVNDEELDLKIEDLLSAEV